MAKLDAVIERLLKDGGAELLVETGAGISLRDASGSKPLVSRKLTTQQILQALVEIAPPEVAANLDGGTDSQFRYDSPFGKVDVRLERSNGNARATVSPARDRDAIDLPPESNWSSGESLELASPADMMDLAAGHTALPEPASNA